MELKKCCRVLKHVLKLYAILTFLQQKYPSGEACGICFLQHGGGDEEGRKVRRCCVHAKISSVAFLVFNR